MKKDAQLANDIKKLQYQLSYSEHISIGLYLSILDKELSEYLRSLCEKTGLPMRKTTSIENVNLINTQSHLQELYYVEPLLMAYQHKIHLLEAELRELKQDSDSLLKFGEQIVEENNFLRKELQTKNQYIQKSEEIGLNANFLKLDNQNLIQKNNLLNEKNNFLLQRLREMDETGQRERMNGTKPSIDLNQTTKQLKATQEKLRTVQLSLIQAQTKLQVLNNQLSNERVLMSDQEKKNGQLQTEILRLRNQLKISKQQLESYLQSHHASTDNLQLQIQTLKNQLLTSQRRENDLFTKAMALQSQNQDKSAKLHNLSLQNTQLQTNNNNILQMLETYEAKVTSQNKKIKQLQNDVKDYNESMLAQRKENQMTQWKLSQKEKEIERKEAQWKKERERIIKNWEQRLDAMKNAMVHQKEGLYAEIEQLKYK